MHDLRKLGYSLQKFFRSEEAYSLLDSNPETAGTMWGAGGCWVIAAALQPLLSGSKLVAVVDGGVQHHVLVEQNGWYLDNRGASSMGKLLKYWRTQEFLRDPRIEPFRVAEATELVCPVKLVATLKQRLKPLVTASKL
jgi:hypothetical protein